MTARRRRPPAEPPSDPPAAHAPQQISLLAPDAAAFVHLVRENLRLLYELAPRFEVAHLAPQTADPAAGESGAAAGGGGRDARLSIRGPGDVASYLGPELSSLQQEQLRVVLLDAQNRVLCSRLVYQGGLSSTPVAGLADLFREAVRTGAQALILVHNHPSGDPTPSPEDVRVTAEAGRAGELLGIDVLDHIVIGHGCHVSLRERGLYAPPAKAPNCKEPAAESAPAERSQTPC